MDPGTEVAADELLRLYGCTEPPAPSRLLRAGALSCVLDNGVVRRLSWKGVELIRSVAYLLRDTDWGTASAAVRELRIDEHEDRFEVRFALRLALREGELDASASIDGTADGRFGFEVAATARTALRTSRCGFVVLHPCDVAGGPLRVEHTDGGIEETSFPALISPGQPVFDIRSLRHAPRPGLRVDCRLEAELPLDPAGRFEMEDQRNWSDASFKTYVGSLLDPWPYELSAGRRLRQRVQVEVGDSRVAPQAAMSMPPSPPTLRVGPARGGHMPALGLGVAADVQTTMNAAERAAVLALRPAWLVAEADLRHGDDAGLLASLQAVRELAGATAARLQLDVICPADLAPAAAAARMARVCDRAGCQPDALRPLPAPYLKSFQPSDAWPELPGQDVYALAFGDAFASSAIGGGMLTYFTELNRKRPPAAGLHFIGHTTCPIVHAADDLSVMETLEALPHIARSVHAQWPGLAYRLGPVTLAMGRNPYGERPAANPQRRRIAMAAEDPRHQGRFGAAWIAGYACAVAPLGLELLSFNHTHGPAGPLLGAGHPDWQPGACVPAWGVQQVLARAGGAPLLALVGVPSGVAGIAWRGSDGAPQVLLANLEARLRAIDCPGHWLASDVSLPSVPGASEPPAHECNGSLSLQPFQVLLLRP